MLLSLPQSIGTRRACLLNTRLSAARDTLYPVPQVIRKRCGVGERVDLLVLQPARILELCPWWDPQGQRPGDGVQRPFNGGVPLKEALRFDV